MKSIQIALLRISEPEPCLDEREPVLRIARRWLRAPSPLVRFEQALGPVASPVAPGPA
jgi:hypothetical protein